MKRNNDNRYVRFLRRERILCTLWRLRRVCIRLAKAIDKLTDRM